ncbi:MAG: hypothetical protein NC822_07380 [Candidatus Omnitrophica bacterium]|nr:hypothetical protein [Candidatus Omnitrophota bacterium]MCM8827400.1 hypothetical protein [Candidatus Omnitrophota bacterium]
MKIKIIILSMIFLTTIGLFTSYGLAQTKTIHSSLTLPLASGITVSVSRVDPQGTREPSDDIWSADWMGDLDFGPLQTVSGVIGGKKWVALLGKYYYALDIGLSGGVADYTKTVNVKGTNFIHPAGSNGLKKKGVITAVVEYFINFPDQEGAKIIGKETFDDGISISFADTVITGGGKTYAGWPRFYIGLATKDPEATVPDPVDAEVFTPADPAGDYACDILVTYF